MDMVETSINNFNIRFAEESDTALILEFIRELAAFEDELDQVTATEELLGESLFIRKGAEVIIGEYDGKPVGFALFHHNFSTFQGRPGIHLVDLYIKPDMRGKGYGRVMLSYLANLTVERNCGRLEWWCHDWNEQAIKFYKRLGAFPLEELTLYRLCDEALCSFSMEYNN